MNQDLFGHTRTVVAQRHALITPDGFVASMIPGWEDAECNITINRAMGAQVTQWFATLPAGKEGVMESGPKSIFMYIVTGGVIVGERTMNAGSFAYWPPEELIQVRGQAASSRLLFFEKTYQPLAGESAPEKQFGHRVEVIGESFLGDPDARLQTLLPDEPAFDMAVNIFTYQPGATLPFVETHIMEHGLLMLGGQGVYRLENAYYPVTEGDVIWMAPWCPQWFVAMGKEAASYIYYKNVNRHPDR